MSFALTLIAQNKNLSAGHFADLGQFLSKNDLILENDPKWLADHKAAYVVLHDCLTRKQMTALRETLSSDKIDVLITPVPQPAIKIMICDMDSTIVDGETLDDMAGLLGIGDQIKEITDRAMRGEIDFEESLRARVALLEGLSADVIDTIKFELKLMPGAKSLVRTMAKSGTRCLLVSGGFTHITKHVAQICGFHAHHGNILGIKDGMFTGLVKDPILAADSKQKILENTAYSLGVEHDQILAVGDGANDLDMLKLAGLSVGFRPKPILEENIRNVLHYADLTALLYAQGFKEEEIIHVES